MKKILLSLLLISGIAISSYGQLNTKAMTSTATGSTTSISCISTTPNYLYVVPTAAYTSASFQASVTRVSTAIGGTIFLQGSIDGTNYYNASLHTGDTVTVANSASQTLHIKVLASDGLMFKYYRLKCTGASSDTMTVTGTFCGRQ